jgi:hypothetical protein
MAEYFLDIEYKSITYVKRKLILKNLNAVRLTNVILNVHLWRLLY